MKGFVVAFTAVVAVAAVVLGVPGSARAQGRTDPALENLAVGFAAAFNARDAVKIASFYADDAVLMTPYQAMVKGRRAIEEHFRNEFVQPFADFRVAPLESVVMGSHAFEVGTSVITVPGSGPASTLVGEGSRKEAGKYVVIYKRVGNAWKIAYDIFNDDDPPQR